MAVPLDQFVQQLQDSGILAGEALRDLLPPKSDPKDAEGLLRELLERKLLETINGKPAAEFWNVQNIGK